MKAMRIHSYGDASVLHVDDIPTPDPAPGQVLIRVTATSFNPSEIGLRNGWLRGVFDLDLPYTLGWDLAGTVVALGTAPASGQLATPPPLGNGVTTSTGATGAAANAGHATGGAARAGLAAGDAVVGHVHGGAAAQFATADPALLVRAPAAIPLAHAAALPVAGLTAWQAVFEHAHIAPGARVLINGAGGGIGGYAVQLARHAGAHVTATASPRSAVTVRALGAHAVHDYTRSALSGSFDAVINLVPLERPDELLPLVRPSGVLVSVTNPVEAPRDGSIRTIHFVMRNDPAHLAALVDLVDRGIVRPDIAAERPLDDLPGVHRAAEAGRLRGKTLLLPWS